MWPNGKGGAIHFEILRTRERHQTRTNDNSVQEDFIRYVMAKEGKQNNELYIYIYILVFISEHKDNTAICNVLWSVYLTEMIPSSDLLCGLVVRVTA
jgi:hypothetical protein